MKRFALGSFLAFSLAFTPQPLFAQTVGGDGAASPNPVDNSQDIDLQQVNAAIDSDRSGLSQSRADAEEIREVIQDDESQAAAIHRRLAGGEATLPRIQADLARAAAALDAERATFEPVRARYDTARAKLDAARRDARAVLERGPEFRVVADVASAAAAARQSAEGAVAQRVHQSDGGRRKQAEIEHWTARIAFFEQAGPAFERDRIAAASRVQDARWELHELTARYLDSDPEVRAARAKAAAADAAVAKLRAENESRLATVPEVAVAGQAVAAEFGPYSAALSVLRHAEARVASIRSAYDATVNGMAADRQTLAGIEDELAQARADLTQVNADIDRLALDLSNGLAAADQENAQWAISEPDPALLAEPVLAWTGVEAPLPRHRGLFPAPICGMPRRLECRTVLARNWNPQPIFIEPSYVFVSGQPFGHDWRQHWAYQHPERPQQHSSHGPNPASVTAAAHQRWQEFQTSRSAMRSREAGVLTAHGIAAAPAAAGSQTAPPIASNSFRQGWAPAPAVSPPPFAGGTSHGGFASPAAASVISPAPSPQPTAPAPARPAARAHR